MFEPRMYEWSQALQKELISRYPTDIVMLHIVSCVQLSKEVTEVLDCLPWKPERTMKTEPREHLLEELVDVFNYFMRLCIVHNVTPDEFIKAWEKKAKIVTERLLPCQDSNRILEKYLKQP